MIVASLGLMYTITTATTYLVESFLKISASGTLQKKVREKKSSGSFMRGKNI